MRSTALVLGYHGCDREVGERILGGGGHLQPSENDYDWLGSGIYFWEDTPSRALEWAEFDSVRAAFVEGEPLYPGAGFHRRTHIQLCVRSTAQVIGYFRSHGV